MKIVHKEYVRGPVVGQYYRVEDLPTGTWFKFSKNGFLRRKGDDLINWVDDLQDYRLLQSSSLKLKVIVCDPSGAMK